jgi:magnesium-transporting ATPase (P-type)
MLFASTTITSGTCIGVVAYTGMKTAIGTIHKQVQQAKEEEEDTPLKQKLDQFGDYLARVIFVICFLVWAMNFNKFFDPMHGSAVKGCIYYFKIAVALAVAAIPEGLPAVITTCLALGTRKMAANNCIERRLPSVETLGCTSVICSDKTGTLTKNQMCAVKFGVIGSSASQVDEFDIEESSYSPESKIVGLNKEAWTQNKNFKHLAALSTLNNRSTLSYSEEKSLFEVQGEPTEAAIKVFAEKLAKVNSPVSNHKANPMKSHEDLMKTVQEIAVLDFSSERKTMSTVVKGYEGASNNTVLLKGAPERVLEKCSSFMTSSGKSVTASSAEKEAMAQKIKAVASQGYRVLGFAIGLDGGNMKHITKANASDELSDTSAYSSLEANLSFVGYICIMDPVRPEVELAIK